MVTKHKNQFGFVSDEKFVGTLLVGSPGAPTVIGLRLTRRITDQVASSLGIENPSNRDVFEDNDHISSLSRVPNVIGRVRVIGSNQWDSYQVAALLRPLGYKREADSEQWNYGWGLSALGRNQLNDSTLIYAGVTGGRGIGDYLSGAERAATFRQQPASPQDPTFGLTMLTGYGGFAGLSKKWFECEDGNEMLWSNFGYGYSFQDSTSKMPALSIRKAQEAWCNLVYQQNKKLGYGVEYHFGQRTVRDGRQGLDHRIQFVLSISTGGKSESEGTQDSAQFKSTLQNVRVTPPAPVSPPTAYRRRL